jgi:hypothetical protein
MVPAVRKAFLALLLASLLGGSAPAAAVTIEGAAFPEALRTSGNADLTLHRASLLRYLRFLKVYVAALYLAPGADPSRVLEDVPKRLEIQYLRSFTADQFRKATEVKIAENVDAETLERLRPRIDELNALYRNVEQGDRYALTYLPGKGTELSYNGRPLGRVEGAEFASAVFSIWLGSAPVDEGLKRELLGSG